MRRKCRRGDEEMRRVGKTGFTEALFFTTALLVPSSELSAQVIETPEGPVEFIGLRNWSPEQVRDTLAAVRPDLDLHSAACAAALRFEVGFPQARVVQYSGFPGLADGYTTITHVEPEQSHQIRYADPPADSLGPIEPILVLSAFSRDAREVDWAPAAVDLRAILDGTSLDAFTEILEILARTSVSVDLAEDLLAGGGEMVLAHLRASHPHLRELARRFLVTISGRDYGEDAIRWGEWIESLGEGSPATSTDEKG